jgi:hypothetical protein
MSKPTKASLPGNPPAQPSDSSQEPNSAAPFLPAELPPPGVVSQSSIGDPPIGDKPIGEPKNEYVVISPLHHDGKRYEVGDTVTLTDAQAASLPGTVGAMAARPAQ